MIRVLFVCLVFLNPGLLYGQSPSAARPIPYPIPLSGEWHSAVEAGTRTMDGVPGEKYWTNYANYKIQAALDPATARVTGSMTLNYENRSPRAIRRLMVHLRQNLYRAEALRNRRVEITGGMSVTNIKLTMGDQTREITDNPTVQVWSVRLPKALDNGQSCTLSMDFSFVVPKSSASPRMGHENFTNFYLGYWYPQVAVFEDVNSWVAEPYMGAGEFYMGYADYDLEITAPHGFTVQATGELTNPAEVLTPEVLAKYETAKTSFKDAVNLVSKDMLGQPGKATLESATGSLTWKFSARNVRDTAVAISKNYIWDMMAARVASKDGAGTEGSCLIHAQYEPNASAWTKAADYTRHTIEFMSKNVMPYPWPHMTAIEGIVGGGMEFPMMTNVGPTNNARQVQEVIAHETVHMWFPMLVGNNETAWAWMDEGVTTFYTALVHGDYFFDESPPRQLLLGYRMGAGGEENPPMFHSDAFGDGRPGYGIAAYSKPAAVFQQLSGLFGQEKVLEAFRVYARAWEFRHPFPQDLFHSFSKTLGEDLNWYFRTWLYETWRLDQSIDRVQENDNGTTIVVRDLGDAPSPSSLRVTFADESQETMVVPVSTWLSGKRSVEVLTRPGVVRVELDPEGVTLDVAPRNNVWKKP